MLCHAKKRRLVAALQSAPREIPKHTHSVSQKLGSACASLHGFLCSAKNVAQLVFGVLENSLLLLRQIFSGAIDIEIQHRHCRLIRRAFAPRAPLSGAFQGKRDLTRIFFFKDIAIEIKGVAMFRYFRRPTPTALRGLLPCLAHRSVEFVGRALRCQNRRQPKRLPYNSVFFTHYT